METFFEVLRVPPANPKHIDVVLHYTHHIKMACLGREEGCQNAQKLLLFISQYIILYKTVTFGAQWLSGRVLDSRPRPASLRCGP